MSEMETCRNGHPWSPENTYTRPDGERRCRACARASDRRYQRSEKGRATQRQYQRSEEYRAHRRRYDNSTRRAKIEEGLCRVAGCDWPLETAQHCTVHAEWHNENIRNSRDMAIIKDGMER